MNWRTRRRKDRQAQEVYFEDHQYCEVCLAEGRGKVSAVETHEILYKSQMGKCTEDNMISLCRRDHRRAHLQLKPYLRRKDLWEIKGFNVEDMQKKTIRDRNPGVLLYD